MFHDFQESRIVAEVGSHAYDHLSSYRHPNAQNTKKQIAIHSIRSSTHDDQPITLPFQCTTLNKETKRDWPQLVLLTLDDGKRRGRKGNIQGVETLPPRQDVE